MNAQQRTLLGIGSLGLLGSYLLLRAKSPKPSDADNAPPTDADAPKADAPHPSGLTKEEIEGKREYTHPTPPGYTRAIPVLPPEANSFAKQALGKPYGTVIGPKMLSDGKTYIAVVESHFDDHVTNPRTGQKDKHWHPGSSMFMQVG